MEGRGCPPSEAAATGVVGQIRLIFDYPEPQERGSHGPAEYSAYESYRPWLRDEFDFRCAYCLKRETWGQVTSEFELDHFEPQSLESPLRLDYLNLVYACRRCNAVKREPNSLGSVPAIAGNWRHRAPRWITATVRS